jgi:hypothetical protein
MMTNSNLAKVGSGGTARSRPNGPIKNVEPRLFPVC